MSLLLVSFWVFAFAPQIALPQDSRSYQQAIEKYRAKDYPAALDAAKQALKEDENNPFYHHIYGLTLAAMEQFEDAEQNLRQAIALKPDEANFHYDYGYVLYQEKKYDQSVPVLKRAVELDKENLMARYLLGKAYVICQDSLHIPDFSQQALEQFKFIAARKPGFPTVHLHMALIYANSGNDEKAIDELNSELRLFPGNVQARMEMGEILLKMGQPDKAYEHLIQAAKEAPTMPRVHYDLAMVYRKRAKIDEAIKSARKCVELDPGYAEAHYLLGQLYRQAGQLESSRQEMKVFQEIKAKEPQPGGEGHP